MKFFSTSLCFGLLALLSVMNLLQSVRGRPHLSSGHELFPAEEHTTQEKLPLGLLTRNPGFQRPSHTGVDLPSKLEELRQLKKLREWFMEAKNAELSNALDDLSSSHPNKRGWSQQSRNSDECLGFEPPQFQGYTYHFYWQACFWKYCV